MGLAFSNEALTVLSAVPGGIQAVGVALGLGLMAIYAYALWFIYILIVPLFRDSIEKKGSTESGDVASTKQVILAYNPALGYLLSGITVPVEALADAFSSLGSLATLDLLRLAIMFLLSALAGLWLAYHNTIYGGLMQVWVCDPVYQARHDVLEIVDILRFLAGGVQVRALLRVILTQAQPIFNMVIGFMWSFPNVAIRVLIDCTLEELVNNPLVLANLAEDVGNVILLFFTALGNYLSGSTGGLGTGYIDMVPTVTAIGVVANTTTDILNCGCLYLNFTWAGFLALVGAPSLGYAVNGTVNAGLSAVQSLFLSIQVPEVPQINTTVVNLQVAVLSLGSWIELLNLQLWVLLFNFIDLLWIISVSDVNVQGNGGLGETLAEAHTLTIASSPVVPILNLTGVQIWLRVVEAPWLGIFTNSVCFALALANATWSLSAMITQATLTQEDIRFFQARILTSSSINPLSRNGEHAASLNRVCVIFGTARSFRRGSDDEAEHRFHLSARFHC
jgi:hypothetical protein